MDTSVIKEGVAHTSHHEIPAKEEHGNAVFSVSYTMAFIQLYITNKMERFSLKIRHAMQVVKFIKEDWPIVFQ